MEDWRISSATLKECEEFLDHVNEVLDKNNKRIILGLDEYEYIDRRFGENRFSIDLLGTIRNSIQSHRRITILTI